MLGLDLSDAHRQAGDEGAHSSVVSGKYDFKIGGYSLTRGLGEGQPLASDVFEIGGHKWRIAFYPEGKKARDVLKQGNVAYHIVTAFHHFPNFPALADKGKASNLVEEGPGQEKTSEADTWTQSVEGAPPGDAQKAAGVFHHEPKQNKYAAVFLAHYAMVFNRGKGLVIGYDSIASPPCIDLAFFDAVTALKPHYGKRYYGVTNTPFGVYDTLEGQAVRVCPTFELVAQVEPDYLPPGHVRQRHPSEIRECKRSLRGIQVLIDHKDPSTLVMHGYTQFVARKLLHHPLRRTLKDDELVIRFSMKIAPPSSPPLQLPPKLSLPQLDIKAEEVAAKLTLAKRTSDTSLLSACLNVAAHTLGMVMSSKEYPDLLAEFPEIQYELMAAVASANMEKKHRNFDKKPSTTGACAAESAEDDASLDGAKRKKAA